MAIKNIRSCLDATGMILVPREGLEPSCLATYAPEAYVSTNFTTAALLCTTSINIFYGMTTKSSTPLSLCYDIHVESSFLSYDSCHTNRIHLFFSNPYGRTVRSNGLHLEEY